ncbi:MAG: elongation factor P [Acholeplasmatales bacterium]|nr:elongation factor P [Acholeplasmatales bacterium]
MINVNELKNGVVIEYDGKLVQIMEFMHVLQNKVAYVRVKMKDLRTGTVTETALKGSDSAFKRCYIDKRPMQYLYNSGDMFTFMDNETYEQIDIPAERLEWESKFMKDGDEVQITMYEGEILGVSLADKVTLEIVDTTPAIKGQATDRKKATLETGLEVTVPAFLENGTKIVVSTIDGSYVSRA